MRTSLVFCGLLLAACGDVADGPGTGPVSPTAAAEGCQRQCQHDIDCGSAQTVQACTDDCVSETMWVRADAFETVIDCLATHACAGDEDECTALCNPTGAPERWEAQCRAVLGGCDIDVNEACETQPDPSQSGDVGFLCLATPAIMDELTACIPNGTACQAGLTCLQGVFQAHGLGN